MNKAQAVELILAARMAASRVGKYFVVDPEKLCRHGGFSAAEIDQINDAVADIETFYASTMRKLSKTPA